MATTIPETARKLLDDANFAHVATLMSDGMPQSTPVWVERDGDVVVFNTATGRAKAMNLARDPRVALSVHDAGNPYSYLQIRGRAELVADGAVDHIHKLSRKYTGEDYQHFVEGEERVTVRVTPEAVDFRS